MYIIQDEVLKQFMQNKLQIPLSLVARLDSIRAFSLLGSIILLIYSIINILIKDYPAAAFESACGIVILLGLHIIENKNDIILGTNIGAMVLFVLSIHNFYSGGFESTGIFWTLVMAIVIIFIKGKNGIWWNIALWIALSLIFILFMGGAITLPYTQFFAFMFLLVMPVVIAFIFFFQRGLDNKLIELEEQRVRLNTALKEKQEQSLEVQKTLNELTEKNLELTKIHRLTVDRELQMSNLKKRLALKEGKS